MAQPDVSTGDQNAEPGFGQRTQIRKVKDIAPVHEHIADIRGDLDNGMTRDAEHAPIGSGLRIGITFEQIPLPRGGPALRRWVPTPRPGHCDLPYLELRGHRG